MCKLMSFTFALFHTTIFTGWATSFCLTSDNKKTVPVASLCMCYHTVLLLIDKDENSVVPCYSLNKYETTGKKQQERQICRWHNSLVSSLQETSTLPLVRFRSLLQKPQYGSTMCMFPASGF